MALAGPGGTVPAIMPERLAATSLHQPVKEVIGSGPFRFLSEEHISGLDPPAVRGPGGAPEASLRPLPIERERAAR